MSATPPASDGPTAAEVARRAGVTPSTLRRWVDRGLILGAPARGPWPPVAVAHARIVARLRERGHSFDEIRRATEEGRLAFGYVEELLPEVRGTASLKQVARRTGLQPALIQRIYTTLGFSADATERLGDEDAEMLGHVAAVLEAGFPLAAFLQLIRVYGQSIAQIADAEVRLFHLYVHEPLMRDGVPGLEVAEQMGELSTQLVPLAGPVMDQIHRRYLHHFMEQDIIGHMEAEVGEAAAELGRMRTAIAFADLAGYTQLTEQQGDEEAASIVERFIADVTHTLPDEARIVKTIGDEVMLVSSDPSGLSDWAVGFQALVGGRPVPRIGLHVGEVLYRDGDYYGREVNLAARVAARAAAGEVLVTRAIVDLAEPHQQFEFIGEVRLKGFAEPTELFLARLPDLD